MTLSLIQRNEWPLSICDLGVGFAARVPVGVSAPTGRFARGPYSVDLLHMNPDQLVDGVLVWAPGRLRDLGRHYACVVPYWELPVLPDRWVELLRGVDEVLAPTSFIRDAIEAALGDDPLAPLVTHFPQAVEPPPDVSVDRERWFPGRLGSTVFLASMDLVSDPTRKNPMGVLDAFRAAAASRDDMTLALKLGYMDTGVQTKAAYSSLRSQAQSDHRIILITDELSDADMWSLYASADAYVSLHRAEGLGLGLMQSMALGTPVIGTAWSGNMDFMSDSDSVLIPYRLVPVEADTVPAYEELNGVAVWAEPDSVAAAQAIAAYADDRGLRERLGRAARESSRLRWDEYVKADALRSVLSRADTAMMGDPRRRARLRRLAQDVRRRRRSGHLATQLIRRSAIATLRGLGLRPPAPEGEIAAGPLWEIDPYNVSDTRRM